ncbi:nicotinate-nucleotide diphosphorylase (carboxylating) [Pneumocystis murina B123]|uniref:Nicotinate-nucleotide pyrophosphorylase [carboxylating] n=1 Tax=Pneumocystis murina (strain B123) TaxID=1069680 RepID=M7NJN1_PNEMU|nr:nicotinate-nucleotide diphosphorylase (carboxylating) [Pneumocystis murina B123]EMR08808.1 nicotinate-nucleotide diphosphorylase (carboxylating) [Pneumocystis murina B123]
MKPTWQTINSNLSNALPISWKNMVREWLKEDIPSMDYGGFVVGEKQESAILFGKSQGILAGVPFFNEIFEQLECRVEWFLEEGENIHPVKKIAVVHGAAKNLLLGERVALNMLSRCSGIATKSKRIGEKLKQLGYHGILAGTRKTTPGFRLVEKYGMMVGGADPHRFDLSSMIMLKDNHIWSKGSITKAVEAARLIGGFSLKIEVEVHSEEEADEAILSGADIIMLDNFHNNDMKIVAQNLKQKWKNKLNFLLECSGGITEENIHEFICNDLDILSTSSIHQSAKHVDFSLKIDKK